MPKAKEIKRTDLGNRFSLCEYDDGAQYITSSHPYDNAEYHWARSLDGGTTWRIYRYSPGQLQAVLPGEPQQIAAELKHLDRGITPRMSHN